MQKIKTIFLGTPEFAVPSLKSLIDDENFEILLAITQSDKKVGREQKIISPPVKAVAQEKGIRVLQPNKISEIENEIRALNPDMAIVVAYGQIIPENFLTVPKHGFINVHGSILPRYRGASVVQAPILHGDTETGVTIMKMDKGLDTGPVINIGKIGLKGTETAGKLHDKLARMGARILPKTIIKYLEGYLAPKAQVGKSRYCKTLTREDGRINWRDKAINIERRVRAMTPWPGTFTTLKGKLLKIIEVDNEIFKLHDHRLGKVVSRSERALVQTAEGGLSIRKLQLEGKKAMTIQEFLRGHEDFIGSILA